MKASLTKRERVLLIAVAYIAVSYLLIQFAIVPSYNYRQSQVERNERLSTERIIVDTKIASEESYRTRNEEYRVSLEQITEMYPSLLRNERIDDILTELCVSSGLEPISLSLSQAKPGPVAEKAVSGTEEESAQSAFATTEAKMTVAGDINQLLYLLRVVEGIEYVHINRLSFYNRTGYVGGGQHSITLYFTVTMMNSGQ